MIKTYQIGYYDVDGTAFILCDKRGSYPISGNSEWPDMGFVRCSRGDKPYKERLVTLATARRLARLLMQRV